MRESECFHFGLNESKMPPTRALSVMVVSPCLSTDGLGALGVRFASVNRTDNAHRRSSDTSCHLFLSANFFALLMMRRSSHSLSSCKTVCLSPALAARSKGVVFALGEDNQSKN